MFSLYNWLKRMNENACHKAPNRQYTVVSGRFSVTLGVTFQIYFYK